MNCPKCGAQIPDGATNCMFCGETISAQPMGQPQQYGGQPMGQPGDYNTVPAYAQTFTPVKTSNKKPIIIAVVSVVVVAIIAVVLFVFILPNMGGVESKLKHRWSLTEEDMGMTATMVYDFKNNKMEATVLGMNMSYDIEWKVTGDDTMTLSVSVLGQTDTQNMKFKLSDGDKSLTLTPVDEPDNAMTLTRAD